MPSAMTLKGFPRPMRLHRVPWEEATGPAGLRLLERTPFIGRETERAELRRLLDQAARGQGSLVMIGGEPGVGKTRLADELLLEARQRGVLALSGHCYEMEGSPPYIPFVEILEMFERDPETEQVVLIGEIGGTGEEQAAQFIARRMSKPVIAFVAGRAAPHGGYSRGTGLPAPGGDAARCRARSGSRA